MSEVDPKFKNSKPVIMTYVNLLAPSRAKRAGKEVGEPVYSASFAFDNDSPDLAALKAKMAEVARAKWPGRSDWSPASFQTPLANGAKEHEKRLAKGKKDNEWMVGKTLLKASSGQIYPPNLGVYDNGHILEGLRDDPILLEKFKSMFYWGAEAFFIVKLSAYDRIAEDAKDGVKAYLSGVLTTGKGKKIGGGASSLSTFSGVIGQYTQEDPTVGETDEENSPF